MSTHAFLSASGIGSTILCPGKPKAEEPYPSTTSEAAEEGTAMHEVAQSCMLTSCDAEEFLGTEVNGFTMNDERIGTIQEGLDYVRSIYNPDIHDLYVEHKFKTRIISRSGGTADVMLNEALGDLHVLDYKFGRRRVEPDAPQLRTYGLFGLEAFPDGQEYAHTHVVQPRIGNMGGHAFKVAELWEWSNDVLKPAAKLALSDNPPRIPGETQCRWCLHKANCQELRDYNMETARMDFAEFEDIPVADELSDEELGTLLNRFEVLESWIKDLRAEAFKRAKAGRYPTGWKLVRGRGARKWCDEDATIQTLLDTLPEELVFSYKLRSVAQMEKEIKANKLDLDISKLWEKKVSYTLAKEDDKREAITTAADDFAGIEYS